MTSPTPPTSVVMTAEVAAALRAPFPPEKIGKLPRVTCRNCSKNYGSCSEHDKKWCDECNGMISPKHIHLDYVGHADTTDRFLEVDPGWNWEPVAFDQRGLPAFDEHGGLWIRLTIAGVTRLGYGDSQGKTGPNAVKEAIGDAFRNAGMRFGVALDLWRKDFPEAEEGPRKGGRAAPAAALAPQVGPDPAWIVAITAEIHAAQTYEEMLQIGNRIDDEFRAGRLTQGDDVANAIGAIFMPKRELLLAERNAAHQAHREAVETETVMGALTS
ncbi:hypothetical protein GCM10010412_082440 [Nonomuraea recticatena]|uniref:Uncharacterized protein n=1 Tax=Nonomuraea recticatena TaxID=46178 RepID=A0ABN3T3T1_9ACTN